MWVWGRGNGGCVLGGGVQYTFSKTKGVFFFAIIFAQGVASECLKFVFSSSLASLARLL